MMKKRSHKTLWTAGLAVALAIAFILPNAGATVGTNPAITDMKQKTLAPLAINWPMFHLDKRHTGATVGEAPDTNNILWTYTAGGQVLSSPAIVDGRVYCASYEDGTVFCLYEKNGTQLWNFTTKDFIPYSSPAVVGGRVYIGSRDSHLYCLDAITGAEIWNFTTGSWIYSNPVVAGGKVYFGSSDNKVYGLNATTGVQLWNFTTGSFVWCSPAVDDENEKVFVGSFDAKMYCLDANTGALIWNFTTGSIVYSSPAIYDNKVYFGSWDHFVYCLNEDTGAKVWSTDIGSGTLGAIFSSPAILAGRVYIGVDYVPIGAFFCLDAATGSIIWNHNMTGSVYGSPAVSDGKVYFGVSQSNRVYCYDVNGTQLWNFTTGDYVDSSPAISDGRLFIGSNDHHLYCFGPSTNITSVTGGLFRVKARLKNMLDSPETINWSIDLNGGLILLGGHTNGTVTIPANSTTDVKSNIILGIGKTTIVVKAAEATKGEDASVFLILVRMR